jgi:hypothetical protein
MAVADTNYRFVYVDIGSYGKDCDSANFKWSKLWSSIQKNVLELPSDRPLSGTEGPNVPHFVVGDKGLALNRNILRPFDGSNRNVKKECTTIAWAEHEGMWNVLSGFWAINEEFSSDRLMSVLTSKSSLLTPVLLCTILFAREMIISLKTLWQWLVLKMHLMDKQYVGG